MPNISRARLVAILGVLLLLTTALFVVYIGISLNLTARNATERTLAQRAQVAADTLDRTLQIRMVEVLTFAALPSMRGFAASDPAARPGRAAIAQSELQSIVAADPSIRAASILDIGANVVLTTDGSMNANWGERAFVQEALAGHLNGSVPARDFGEVSQYYSAPLIDNAGKVAGALVVRVAVQEMWNALAAQRDVVVVDENGVRLVDTSAAPQPFVALTPLAQNLMQQLALEKKYGSELMQIGATNWTELALAVQRNSTTPLAFRDSSGQTVYAAPRRLKTNAWTVIALEPENAVLANAADALWDGLKIGLVGLLAGIGLGLIAASRMWQSRRES